MFRFSKNSMEKLEEELSAAVALTALGVTSNNCVIRPSPPQIPLPEQMLLLREQQPPAGTVEHKTSIISSAKRKSTNTVVKRNFPQKLFDLLQLGFHADIVTWLPGGTAFIVIDKRRFANEILPGYFKESQYTSFTRKLSRWKFTRVSRGPYMGAYYHKYFKRDNRSLCKFMTCNNTKKEIKVDTTEDHEESTKPHPEILEEFTAPNTVLGDDPRPLTLSPSAEGSDCAASSYSCETSGRHAIEKEALALKSSMQNTNDNILLIKQQLMEIHLRKVEVEKRKQLMMMRAEANRLKEINCIIQRHAERDTIIAAARALNRSNTIVQQRIELAQQHQSWKTIPQNTITPIVPLKTQSRNDKDFNRQHCSSDNRSKHQQFVSRAFAA